MKTFSIVPFLIVFLFFSFRATAQNSFYQTNQIQNISIKFDEDNWKYQLDSLRYNGDELLSAEVNINGTIVKAGVRYRNGRVFTPGGKKNGLFISLKDSEYQGVKHIDLSAALRDPSFVREVLAYEIARDIMPAPRANYAKVFINHEYYGLFVNVEVVDERFAKKHFNNEKASIFYSDPDPVENASEGCKENIFGSLQVDKFADCLALHFDKKQGVWTDLYELTLALQTGGEALEQKLDIDNTLWMLAFNNVFLNLNSYSGGQSPNYYLVQDDQGRMVPVLGNLNLAFGSYKNTGVGSDLHTPEMLQLPIMLHADNAKKPLIQALLSVDEYKRRYLYYIKVIGDQYIKSGQLEERAKFLQKFAFNDLIKDENRHYNTSDLSRSLMLPVGKRSKIPGILPTVNSRYDFLRKTDELLVVPPALEDPMIEGREKYSPKTMKDFRISVATDNYTKEMYIHYRFSENEPFKKIAMLDDGKHSDEAANDHTYGVIIKPKRGQEHLEYYIEAANVKMAAFSPANYKNEIYTISLSDINN